MHQLARRMPPSLPSIRKPASVEILDYVVVEDGGVLVNPMIVDGQIHRRHRAGHRHGAVTRRCRSTRRASRSPRRSPTTCCPGRTEVPDIRILHMETPSPYTEFGQKGVGEGGAIAPPAAITNAVNDALHRPRCRALRDPSRRDAFSRRSPTRSDRHAVARESLLRRCIAMKPVAFDYARPARSPRRCRSARPEQRPDAKVLAGGQIARADAQPAPRPAGSAGRHHAHPRAGTAVTDADAIT